MLKKRIILYSCLCLSVLAFLFYNLNESKDNQENTSTIKSDKEDIINIEIPNVEHISISEPERKATVIENVSNNNEAIVGISDLTISDGYVNEELLSEMQELLSTFKTDEIISYSGIVFEQDIKTLFQNYNENLKLEQDYIDVVDAYGNQIRFTNCKGNGEVTKSNSENSIIKKFKLGHVINCSDEYSDSVLKFQLKEMKTQKAIPDNPYKPIETNISFSDEGSLLVQHKNVKYENSTNYEITYRIVDKINNNFYFGKIDGDTNTGVVVATTERTEKFFYFN